MSRHAKVMAEHGIALIDPFPLLQATDRPDRFHTSLTAEHLSTTVNWYKALISATVVNRLVVDLRSEMVANRREVVFYEHFHLNKPRLSAEDSGFERFAHQAHEGRRGATGSKGRRRADRSECPAARTPARPPPNGRRRCFRG